MLTLTPAICKKAHAGFAADRQHLHYLRYNGSQGQSINLKRIHEVDVVSLYLVIYCLLECDNE